MLPHTGSLTNMQNGVVFASPDASLVHRRRVKIGSWSLWHTQVLGSLANPQNVSVNGLFRGATTTHCVAYLL